VRTIEQVLDDVADAILDGTPVDWTAAESSAEGAARPLVTHLRVLAAIANLHRDTRPTSTVPAPSFSEPVREPLEPWGHLQLLEPIGRGFLGAHCADKGLDTKLLPPFPQRDRAKLMRRADW
jgi:hypothetical protein